MSANAFDIVIIVLLAWSAYRGYSNGLIASAASLAGLLLGVWGAVKFSGITSGYLSRVIHVDEKYMAIISFAVTFILIVIAIQFIARLVQTLAETVALGLVNNIFGAAFGMLKVAFIISVVLVLLNAINVRLGFMNQDFQEKSLFYKPISRFAPTIFNYLDFEKFKPNQKPATESIDV